MVTVQFPALLRPHTGGAAKASVEAGSVREIAAELVRQFPALEGRLVDDSGQRPEIFFAINGEEAFSLDQAVPDGAEVFILPAIAGG